MKAKKTFILLIPFIVVGLFTILHFGKFYRNADWKVYDLMLHIKPPVRENKSILFLDVDDIAISNVGMWPWSRDIMADGLILMKEFNAKYAVFDIAYMDKSPLGVNSKVLNENLPEQFNEEFSQIESNIKDLFEALKSGNITLADAEGYINDLSGLTEQSKDKLLKSVRSIARDNDKYLGEAARFFGNSFFTVTLLDNKNDKVPKELKDYALKNFTLKNLKVVTDFNTTVKDIQPAILPILKGARGAGFPNIIVDNDGVRRRIALLEKYKGKYFGQLALVPLLSWLGDPDVELHSDKLVIKNAGLPGKKKHDITIPLAEDKTFLLNWPKKDYLHSFRHLSYWELVLHKRLEDNLIHNLKIMDDAGYLSYYKGETGLMDPYKYAESVREDVLKGEPLSGIEDYRKARELFFKEVGKFLYGDAESEITSQVNAVLNSGETPEDQKPGLEEIKKEVPKVFKETRGIYRNLSKTRSILRDNLPDSFCFIGQTGTSTTDIGVNPFESKYMNVGTHAAMVNTVLSGSFLDDMPWWYSVIAALVLSVVVTVLILNLRPFLSIIIGVVFLGITLAAGILFFLFTGTYLDLVTPAFSVFLTFIAITFLKFLRTEQEKSFLRNAFTHYLSTDVVSELISHPEKLNLGGEKKYLTALFTDVRGFSTISESLDAQDLVKLLNEYLSEMSNIILDQKGTIDKYEGDAIISFFGAPVEFKDHAFRACLSAVRMKKMETYLNEHFLAEKMAPSVLLTRIGINTGEMVVGNMGTEQKMDYTMMGNSVNLASRLEGVNKQYGTWVLISETTRKEIGDHFLVRKLDRVRVVGIKQPVRLFELLDEENLADAKVKEAVEVFHGGLELFEERDWEGAAAVFNNVLKVNPNDGPSAVYIKRCRDFRKKNPPASWDGVFNLSIK
ncbi:MAG: adenylate/guanylate cyclase domain-containing protein [Spirochaetales bacterium]|nr:adenylate/guanylate cyclase domain-containing protein [Spirochaetales bacterium]